MFLSDFKTLLERVVILPGDLVLLGDFNFHVDDNYDADAAHFLDLIKGFDSAHQSIHT